MTPSHFILSTLIGGLLAFSGNPAFADQPAELVRGKVKKIMPGRYAKAAIEVDMDVSGPVAGRKSLSLQLPNGRILQLERSHKENRGNGNALWNGRVNGNADSEAILTVRKGRMAGRVRVANDVYEIRPGRNRKTVIELLDAAALPACGTGPDQWVGSTDSATTYTATPAAASGPAGQLTIQLLTVYTPAARSDAGDSDDMETIIQAAVDNTNFAFSESGMNVRFELLHMQEVAHVEQATSYDDLDWLTADPGVAALRNQYGADMVSMITDAHDVCGLGWVQRAPGSGFADYAYSLSAIDCAVGNLTFAHEHGHNMGMEHDRGNSAVGAMPQDASYPWSFGWYVDGSHRTVMSYDYSCANGCPRAPRFSNPDISFNDLPTGVSNEADNARTGELTAPIIAAYRSSSIVNTRVNQSMDDVEESVATGEIYADSGDLEFGYDGTFDSDQYIGLRFRNIGIPPGARVTKAWLEFVADETASEVTNTEIRAVAEDFANPFTAAYYDVSSRTTTSAVTYWNMPEWPIRGEIHRSPDISSVVQEVIDRQGWLAGNAIAFVISGTGHRTAESWEGAPNQAPLLHVEYAIPQIIAINVLPWDGSNRIDPNMVGKVPVTLLSSATFDATQINPASLRFGPGEASATDPIWWFDIDAASGLDATAQFEVSETDILCGDTEVSLTGATYAGDEFIGTDTIETTQCETGSCHP
jgi:hypothetical protein